MEYEEDTFYYDTHTLYMHTGDATHAELNEYFASIFRKLQKEHDIKDISFRINVPMGKNGKAFGYAFMYVRDSSLYYICIGKNKDGSLREEYVEDPDWVKPDPIIKENKDLEFVPLDKNLVWADALDEFEINKKNTCPKILVKKESLLCLPPFNGQEVTFTLQKAMAKDVREGFSSHVLKTKCIPDVFTCEDIRKVFEFYAVESRRRELLKAKRNNSTNYYYPNVTSTKDGYFYISFDPNTKDAMFALHMTKKYFLQKEGKEYTLFFGYAKKREENNRNEEYKGKKTYYKPMNNTKKRYPFDTYPTARK